MNCKHCGRRVHLRLVVSASDKTPYVHELNGIGPCIINGIIQETEAEPLESE